MTANISNYMNAVANCSLKAKVKGMFHTKLVEKDNLLKDIPQSSREPAMCCSIV